jgi:hypothetical protein
MKPGDATRLSLPMFLLVVGPTVMQTLPDGRLVDNLLKEILELNCIGFEGRNELGGVVFRRDLSRSIESPDFKMNGHGREDTVTEIHVRLRNELAPVRNTHTPEAVKAMLKALYASQQSAAVEIGILDIQCVKIIHAWVGRIRPQHPDNQMDPNLLIFNASLTYNDPDGLAAAQLTADRLNTTIPVIGLRD